MGNLSFTNMLSSIPCNAARVENIKEMPPLKRMILLLGLGALPLGVIGLFAIRQIRMSTNLGPSRRLFDLAKCKQLLCTDDTRVPRVRKDALAEELKAHIRTFPNPARSKEAQRCLRVYHDYRDGTL